MDTPEAGPTEIELLRVKDDDLRRHMISVGWLRMIALIVCWYLLVAANSKLTDASVQSAVTAVAEQQKGLNINDSLDPFTMRYRKATTGSSFTKLTPSDGASYSPQQQKLLDVRWNLANKYHDSFVVKLTALGTDINVDLRTVVLTTPLWLPLLQIYMFVVKEKRKIVRAIAAKVVKDTPKEQRFVVDQIIFLSPRSAYVRYPEVFADRIFYCAAGVWFLGSLAAFGSSVENAASKAQSKTALAIIFQLVLASLIYSSAYASGIGQQMRSEVAEYFEDPIQPDLWSRCFSKLERLSFYLTKKIDFRKLLVPGAAAILTSLFVATSVVGCHARPHLSSPSDAKAPHSRLANEPGVHIGDPRPGYRMLSDLADWPLAVKAADKDGSVELSAQDVLGRYLYRWFVAVSVLALALCIPPIAEAVPVFAVSCLKRLCLVAVLYEICELAGPYLLQNGSWFLAFLTSIAVLVCIREKKSPAKAVQRKRRLMVAFIPLVLADGICLWSIRRVVPGFVAFTFGCALVTLGLWNLHTSFRVKVQRGVL